MLRPSALYLMHEHINAELLEMLAPQFEQELKHRYADEENTFIELVRGAIQQTLTGRRPSIEEVADDLHMSSRTLQRRCRIPAGASSASSMTPAGNWRATTSAIRCWS